MNDDVKKGVPGARTGKRAGRGQGPHLSCAIHEAVAKCTEVDLMSWVLRRAPVLRQTCRHARETVSPFPSIVHTKDGRWGRSHRRQRGVAGGGVRPGGGAKKALGFPIHRLGLG